MKRFLLYSLLIIIILSSVGCANGSSKSSSTKSNSEVEKVGEKTDHTDEENSTSAAFIEQQTCIRINAVSWHGF